MPARKSSAPLPGRSVRGSRSGKPVMALLDQLGRRWALRVIWALRQGPLNFRALQAECGVSPSVLNQRLAELRQALLIESGDAGYQLTALGTDLLELFAPVSRFAERWARALGENR